jgi:formylglycine-generating enzyme required for sulfatase activity
MMKTYSALSAAACLLVAAPVAVWANALQPPLVYETPKEFIGSGDFDGDGLMDVVIVDKESGKYRLGYQQKSGGFQWVDCRPTGLKTLAGFSIGKLLAPNLDAMVFAAPDANQLVVVDAVSPTAPGKPITISFTAGIGPSTVVALGIGGAGSTPLADLYVASIYNSPDANLGTLHRNDKAEFPKLAEVPLSGTASRGNHISLAAGQPDLLCLLISGDQGDTFRADDLSGGTPVTVATVTGLPAGADYIAGNFRGGPMREFLFFKPGENNLLLRPVEQDASGHYRFGSGSSFDLGQPVRRVVALNDHGEKRLFVIFGEGQKAGVYSFDGEKAPALVQSIDATNDQFTCAASLPTGFVAFLQLTGGKFSNRYQTYNATDSGYTPVTFGKLASLADNDNSTVPDISARITATSASAKLEDMTAYTNTIPGTRVSYVMVPIPAGEFLMGSPEGEKARKPDEGPQHKVKIEPFWMGQHEVTWNEYELFMYPDEERRTRGTVPTDAAGDKLADAVTHPSKPYVEMSFGMGKDGFPAISMTQHAANKYCQWLSAKTGQFYRLPTEAEWEYACRAGTTTAYFFGDDASNLGDYAWFEQNSDFKYQKVGKKKPNPWGLYDMYGNVVEWVLDQYDPDFYKKSAGDSEALEPWDKATKPYPISVRGGSWDDDAAMCRSAARRGSDRAWKAQDPQLPKSIWYFSDAQWIGFRIIRPLKVPTTADMQKYWTSGVERD